MSNVGDAYAKHLISTLQKADRYLMTGGSAAVVFWVFSFAEFRDPVHWSLLGFPLELNALLAQVFAFSLSAAALLFADQAVLHSEDLVKRTGMSADAAKEAFAIPSILTLGAPGRFLFSVGPSILLCFGLWNVGARRTWSLHWFFWASLASVAAWGVAVFAHAQLRLGKWYLDRRAKVG